MAHPCSAGSAQQPDSDPAQLAQPSAAGAAQPADVAQLAASVSTSALPSLSSLSLNLSPAEPEQPGQSQPRAADTDLETLKVGHPDIDWDEPVTAGGRRTLGQYVLQHMPQIWGFFKSDSTAAPELIVFLAKAGLADRHMPYKLARLQNALLPHVPPLTLEEFVSWQADALAVQFAPKQHRVLAKNETVPFKTVRQAGGQRAGSFGTVRKVMEGEQVYATKTGTVEHLTAELDVLAKLPVLQHSVQLRASYEQARRMHLVMSPWADVDLGMFIERPEVLPAWLSANSQQRGAMIANWMHCLVIGLAEMHRHNVKHKDIKPANILLAMHPHPPERSVVHPVFCDFGLSKFFMQQSRSANQSGTVFYQAPEQLAGQPAGRKADVFSLGCVLLELALMAAGKKRSKLVKQLNRAGFAASDCIKDGTFVNILPDHSAWWHGIKDLLLRMLNGESHSRPHGEEAARIMQDLCSTAGHLLYCHHQPQVQLSRQPASPSPLTSPSDSESSDGECLL